MSARAQRAERSVSSRVSSWRLVVAHARAQGMLLLRSPAQLLFLLFAPTAALLAIVTPQQRLGGDVTQSAIAVAQMAVLGGLAVSVFGLGINAAEERASPWSSFVRTLPASGWIVTAGRLLVTSFAVIASMIPLLLAAWTTTQLPAALGEAGAPALRLLAVVAVAVLGCVPFLGIALVIAYTCSPATTVALTQLVVAPLAFLGGLIVPPDGFAPWLATASAATPTRAVRDAVLAELTGGQVGWASAAVWGIWSVAALLAAGWAYSRDEGRRYR